MKCLIFGGQSKSNIEWLKTFSDLLQKSTALKYCDVHTYNFWEHGVSSSSDAEQAEVEVKHALKLYGNTPFDVLIGKSFGCYIAIKTSEVIKPQFQVLIGFPTAGLQKLGINNQELLGNITIPTLIILNEGDAEGELSIVRAAKERNPKIVKLLLINEQSHKYDTIDTYTKEIDVFVKG